MCKFFSLLSSGDGEVFYFSPEQRIKGVRDRWDNIYNYDSHSSIACYFLGNTREDYCNKWEYSPYLDDLVLDEQHTADDRDAVMAEIAKIDWTPLLGDVVSARKFIAGLRDVHWFQRDGILPHNAKLYGMRAEANSKSLDMDGQDPVDSVFDLICKPEKFDMWDIIHDAIFDVMAGTCNIPFGCIYDASRWATNLVFAKYACPDVYIPEYLIQDMEAMWQVYTAGYGLLCKAEGKLYCYETV